jgi:cytochrome c oxidase cbb3-type subunit 3
MAVATLAGVVALAGCEREKRDYQSPPSATDAASVVRLGPIQAGPAASYPASGASGASVAAASAPASTPSAEQVASAAAIATAKAIANPMEANAYAVSQGKKLYRWFNCNGCHAAGGGAIGPALMDDQWIYGHEPAQIVATILQGRPNGMPSFAGRVTDEQAWQLAAYVRSMSGQLRKDVAPSRADSISAGPSENRRKKEALKDTGPPKDH